MPEYYIGLMSGTSMDGIDAVLVDFSDETKPNLVTCYSHDWPDDVHQQLLTARHLPDAQLDSLSQLDIRLGEIFADAALKLLEIAEIPAKDIIAIGNHGQTIRHRPNIAKPFSLQIGDAVTLAQITGIRVIDDFRSADIKAGGQGAPLAPAFHEAMLRTETENRGILNLGGIANLTVLPSDKTKPVTGFDTGPASTLMDAWISSTRDENFDNKGEFAHSGEINQPLLTALLTDSYLKIPPPKSTGFEHYNLEWLNQYLNDTNLSDADVQATLCEFTARSITDAVTKYAADVTHILACGGGVHNNYLMERIQQALPKHNVESTKIYGIHPDWMEAIAFAWLARCNLNNQVINLTSITGASKNAIAGTVTEA